MSTKSNKHKTHCLTPNGFMGIGEKNSKNASKEVYNFRIMSDGSVKKRSGFKRLASLPGTPSYFSVFNINSSEVGIAVIGNSVFEVDLESGNTRKYFGTLDSSPEKCSIVFYKEKMLIFDGKKPKMIDSGEIKDFNGYVPLYGTAWHPIAGGQVNEPLNLASERYRVNYTLSADTTKIRLPSNVLSVDYCELDGSALYEGDYVFDSSNHYVSSDYFSKENGSLTFWVTFDNSNYQGVYSVTQAISVNFGCDSILFCYGRPNTQGIYCYRSVPVSEEQLLESSSIYPYQLDLYIPSTSFFTIGSGDNIIRSVIPLDDRVIVFSENDSWLVPVIDDMSGITPLNRNVGCVSHYAALYCGDFPVTVCHDRLFLLKPTLDPYNPLNAVCVSDSFVTEKNANSESVKLFVNIYKNEIWIFDSSSSDSLITVYNYEAETFSHFGGFHPSFAFTYSENVGFVEGSSLYVFKEECVCDERSDGSLQSISATYTSPWMKLDETGRIKHADRLILEAYSGENGNISVTLRYNNGSSKVISLNPAAGSDSPQIFSKRLPHTPFRELCFTLNATGASSERIYDVSLDLTVNDGNY